MKNNIKSHIEFGLDLINEHETVEVNVKKLAKIYKVFGELISFFHQPGHYENIEEIHKYLGNKHNGMFSILCQIYYKDFEEIFPRHIKDFIESDEFYNPNFQYYRLPNKKTKKSKNKS
ncbi:MAG: hypothetical protein MUF43_14640 [Flavobacterium sp.]|nr:hypothetical protein [Flavobacterium sp.]